MNEKLSQIPYLKQQKYTLNFNSYPESVKRILNPAFQLVVLKLVDISGTLCVRS